jgi:hypothetical protein
VARKIFGFYDPRDVVSFLEEQASEIVPDFFS